MNQHNFLYILSTSLSNLRPNRPELHCFGSALVELKNNPPGLVENLYLEYIVVAGHAFVVGKKTLA